MLSGVTGKSNPNQSDAALSSEAGSRAVRNFPGLPSVFPGSTFFSTATSKIKSMKSTLLKISLLIVILAMGCFTQAHAQSASTNQFYSTAWDWATSDNTNLNISALSLELSQGYIQPANAGAITETTLQYNFQSSWNFNGSAQYLGAGSAINGGDFGGGYAIYRGHSIRADFDLDAGYGYSATANIARFEVRPKLFLEKLFTATTYGRTGLSLPVGFKGRNTTTPQVYVEFGFGVLRGSSQ